MMSKANTKLYQKPKTSLKLFFICPANSDLNNPASADGTNIIACAKIIGITPDALSFKGIYCLAPKIFLSSFPPVVLLAYCTGTCLTARVK